MKFRAKIKTTKQRRTASLDNAYEITLMTDNPMIMDLGKLDADSEVEVDVGLA